MRLDLLNEHYPVLAQLDPDERDGVLGSQAQWIEVPAGTSLFDEGQPCKGFPLVVRGAVAVKRGSLEGRELELYRVTPGELCVVSTSCLFGRRPLSARGLTSEATALVLLSPAGFERWASQEPFRRYVFGVFADRLADLMALVEAVAFQQLDQRLAAALLGHGAVRRVTHQALADELGTVREMVTRLLHRFEADGWVELGRERITVLDPAALQRIAAGRS